MFGEDFPEGDALLEFSPGGILTGDLLASQPEGVPGNRRRNDDDSILVSEEVIPLGNGDGTDLDGLSDTVDIDAALAVGGMVAEPEDGKVEVLQFPDIPGAAGKDRTVNPFVEAGGGHEFPPETASGVIFQVGDHDFAGAEGVDGLDFELVGLLGDGLNAGGVHGEGTTPKPKSPGQGPNLRRQSLIAVAGLVENIGYDGRVEVREVVEMGIRIRLHSVLMEL